MRIKWSAENAREIQKTLEEIQTGLENCTGMSDEIHTALAEANPNRANKRLNRLEDSFDGSMRRVKKLTEEMAELRGSAVRMSVLFEEAETEALRILRDLERGQKAGAERHSPTNSGKRPAGGEWTVRLPIRVPRPGLAPMPRVSPYGPIPTWLAELGEKNNYTLMPGRHEK